MVELVPRRFTSSPVWMANWIPRPVIGLDLDGTCGYYHEHFLRFAEAYLGRSMPFHYSGRAPFYREMGVSKSTYREIKLRYRQGGLKRSMPVRERAADFTRIVRAAGAEVYVCTTRPYLRLDNIDPDTRHWLRRNRMQYDGVLFGEKKYRDLARIVGADRVVGVIDDLPEQVRAAERAKLPAFLMDREYNRREEVTNRLSDLEFAIGVFQERVRNWIDEQSRHDRGSQSSLRRGYSTSQ